MSQTSIERLRDYLVQLPPQSQALLMREFERAIERGEDASVATMGLEQLRQIVRPIGAAERLSRAASAAVAGTADAGVRARHRTRRRRLGRHHGARAIAPDRASDRSG